MGDDLVSVIGPQFVTRRAHEVTGWLELPGVLDAVPNGGVVHSALVSQGLHRDEVRG